MLKRRLFRFSQAKRKQGWVLPNKTSTNINCLPESDSELIEYFCWAPSSSYCSWSVRRTWTEEWAGFVVVRVSLRTAQQGRCYVACYAPSTFLLPPDNLFTRIPWMFSASAITVVMSVDCCVYRPQQLICLFFSASFFGTVSACVHSQLLGITFQ